MTQSKTTTRVITRTVIKTFVSAGVLSSAIIAPNSLVLVDKYFKTKDRANAKHTLRYLKYRKLIEVTERRGQQYYRLTKSGYRKYHRIVLEELVIKKPRKWDGKWRLVMFDIPTNSWHQREELLKGLKQLGFYMLQRSAWIHPFNCEKEVGILLNHVKLEKYVSFIVVEEGNFVSHATEYFKARDLLM